MDSKVMMGVAQNHPDTALFQCNNTAVYSYIDTYCLLRFSACN